MKIHYREKVSIIFDRFRSGVGTTSLAFRRAVEEQAARWATGQAADEAEPIPEALQSYLKKVTLHAYKITDADIQELKAAGYSEDEIFELTLSATLGASRARLDLGLSLLQSGQSGAE